MFDAFKQEVEAHGDRMAMVPIRRLEDIRRDLEELQAQADLNQFQRFILSKLFALDLPEAGFEIRSILLVASPSPASAPVTLTWQGRRIASRLPASYVDKERAPVRVGGYLSRFLNPLGWQARHAPRLPHKRLAARSGLARYGRNNITYVEGLGSFLNLGLYFTDLPCEEDPWQEVHMLEACQNCQACLRSCPTGAILPDRFLIDNERCLTYFNEGDSQWQFPGWIDPSAHHTLYGCMRCQMACPANKPYGNSALEPVEFDEEETTCLLERRPFDTFSDGLRQKVEALGMQEYLGALPRNIRALIAE